MHCAQCSRCLSSTQQRRIGQSGDQCRLRSPRHPLQYMPCSITSVMPSSTSSHPLSRNQPTTTRAASSSWGARRISQALQSSPHAPIISDRVLVIGGLLGPQVASACSDALVLSLLSQAKQVPVRIPEERSEGGALRALGGDDCPAHFLHLSQHSLDILDVDVDHCPEIGLSPSGPQRAPA